LNKVYLANEPIFIFVDASTFCGVMKVFITASFKDGKNRVDIEQLCSLVRKSGFEDFCFIRDV
jgi:hypothetical protein